MQSERLAHLLHPVTKTNLARKWLKEDCPSFDYGGFVVGEREEKAWVLCKSPGVLAGAPFFEAVFKELDCTVKWFHTEGETLSPVCKVAEVSGKVRNLLLGERVALNCITRCSGIATFARQLKTEADRCNWKGEVSGTRKTTPGFRIPEKYAVLVGGISTHRHDLSSMIMLKDNHIWSAGSIKQAVKDAKSVGGFSTKVEVECRSVKEATEAAQAGCDVVMLDNFDTKSIHEAAQEVKAHFPHLIIEASGGVTLQTIREFFGPHIDVISLSLTTQGYSTVDFSLKIQKEGRDPENPLVVM